MKTTTIRYDNELDREIGEQAKKEDRSKNKLMVRAIKKYLEQEARGGEMNGKTPGSCY